MATDFRFLAIEGEGALRSWWCVSFGVVGVFYLVLWVCLREKEIKKKKTKIKYRNPHK